MAARGSVFLIVTFLLFLGNFVFAEEGLTPKQQQDYDSQKLTVTGLVTVMVNKVGGGIVGGVSGMTPDSRNWTVTKGYERITEPEFLKTLGLDDEAAKSEANLTAKGWLTWGGFGGMIIGVAVCVLPFLLPATTYYDEELEGTSLTTTGVSLFLGGVALAGGGFVCSIVGLCRPVNTTPYGRATSLAENYNAELLVKIAGE